MFLFFSFYPPPQVFIYVKNLKKLIDLPMYNDYINMTQVDLLIKGQAKFENTNKRKLGTDGIYRCLHFD